MSGEDVINLAIGGVFPGFGGSPESISRDFLVQFAGTKGAVFIQEVQEVKVDLQEEAIRSSPEDPLNGRVHPPKSTWQ